MLMSMLFTSPICCLFISQDKVYFCIQVDLSYQPGPYCFNNLIKQLKPRSGCSWDFLTLEYNVLHISPSILSDFNVSDNYGSNVRKFREDVIVFLWHILRNGKGSPFNVYLCLGNSIR